MQTLNDNFARVLTAAKINKPLTYKFDGHQTPEPGCLVRVPLGNRVVTAAVSEIVSKEWIQKEEPSLNIEKIRLVDAFLPIEYALSKELLELILWCSRYYHSSLGLVVSAALPKSLLNGKPVTRTTTAYWQSIASTEDISALKTSKQKQLLEWLCQNPNSSTKEIITNGFGRHAINALSKKKLIANQALLQPNHSLTHNLLNESVHQLSDEQNKALNLIESPKKRQKPFLINGVTGSGKTEIYLQRAQAALEQKKQILLLVPEIGLIKQTISRVKARFHCTVMEYHSNSSEGEKIECWTQVKKNDPLIVVGTRSSIFLPFSKLGLIVLDEEHDLSFKQHEGFRYNARDLAVIRAKSNKAELLLGSATPSIESLYNVERGLFTQTLLSKRIGNRRLPIWKYCKPASHTGQNPLSDELLNIIALELDQQNQVLIFINRRGYAPKLQCNQCGWQAICEACDSSMTIHNNPRQLICHRCDQRSAPPKQCPCCQSRAIFSIGSGTERIEQSMEKLFPKVPRIRIDRDSTQRKGSFEAMLDSLQENKAGILIGTQMLTKGHHLPGISLVVVLGADSALMSHDFRSIEHLSQSLTQVAGRAGRGIATGKVVVETSQPEHPLFTLLAEQVDGKPSYEQLSHEIIQNRRLHQLPPFSFSSVLHANCPDFDQLMQFMAHCKTALDDLAQQYEIETIGPMPSPTEKTNRRFRYQIQFYAKSRSQLHSALSSIEQYIAQLRGFSKIRISIDIDPLSMD